MTLLDIAQKRRSCYALNNSLSLTETQLTDLIKTAVKHAPSAFNSQSSRVLILLGEKHHAFWQLTENELKKIVPADNFAPTAQKIAAFDKAHGTLLFFEDWTAVEKLQATYPAYKDTFPIWAYQANGMLEYLIWAALAEQGVGASLQHYNPLVDRAVQQKFNVPAAWKLVAQMPFGTVTEPPAAKEFLPLSSRVRLEK